MIFLHGSFTVNYRLLTTEFGSLRDCEAPFVNVLS